ncbi:hypothetical protein ACFQ6C_26600 [Streptomyces sp. NPDC056454]|uniref:hypothetical protein n=1 Tax=Streptomyces sp. NPDC056454 TaxID=3345823 RepID=UPI00368581E2
MAETWTCPGCRDSVTLTPARRLRVHDDPRTGSPCSGKGFCIDEPEYPQLIKLWGWETGIQMMKQRTPGWVPPTESGPHPMGTLQDLMLKAYPSCAESFGYGAGKGITFRVGRRWYFAAPDGHVGEKYPSHPNAADALHEYMKRSTP